MFPCLVSYVFIQVLRVCPACITPVCILCIVSCVSAFLTLAKCDMHRLVLYTPKYYIYIYSFNRCFYPKATLDKIPERKREISAAYKSLCNVPI